ncbi:hypothetical protein SB392_003498 [Escherichia coli]|nr:hypothetical protein [Escherichia coli]ELO2395875.1 hypothetical protein [Escherichia coli]ELU4744401.1 hypothetical protein [Escherichia coli]
MTYADGGKVHQLHTSLDCEGCKNHGWLVRSGWFTYPDIGDVQIRVLRLVDLLNSNLRFAEISAGKAKAQKRALEQYQIITLPADAILRLLFQPGQLLNCKNLVVHASDVRHVASAILRFALRSVSYSAKVQICILEQYQPVTTVTVERGYYLSLCCESLLVTNK